MNDKADKSYKSAGGRDGLIGKSIFGSHPESANLIIKDLLLNKKSNTYTIEKNGKKKIIIQKPWYEESVFMGLIEMVFDLPLDMPNHKRK